MTPGCTGCTATDMVIWKFSSAPVTLTAPSAGSSLTFYTTNCCRDTFDNMAFQSPQVLRSIMFSAGANRSSAYFDFKNQYHSHTEEVANLEAYSPNYDSVSIQYDHPQSLMFGLPVDATYAQGFSDTVQMAPTDFLTDYGIFHSGTVTPGVYLLNFKIEEYSMGSRTCQIGLETALTNITPSSNNSPNVFGSVRHGNWIIQDSVYFRTSGMTGDTLQLQFEGSDFDIDPDLGRQFITADMNHMAHVGGMTLPTLTPVSPQVGLTDTIQNKVNWTWIIDGTVPDGFHRFVVRFEDDNCPKPGIDFALVVVEVDGYKIDSLHICAGDSVQLLSPAPGPSYVWTPSTGLADPTLANPTASPSTTTTYVLTIDGNKSAEYTVHVGPIAKPILIQPTSTQLETSNYAIFEEHEFLHYYVPFNITDSLVNITASGFYHAIGRKGDCEAMSDSLVVNTDNLEASWIINYPMTRSERITIPDQTTYNMTLDVGSFGSVFKVEQIIIPGGVITDTTGELWLTARDYYGLNHVMQATSLNGHSLIFQLDSGAFFLNGSFKLVMVSGDAELPIARGLSLPYSFNGGSVNTISGSIQGQPVTNDVIPFVFRGAFSVGIEEHKSDIWVYPQPADQRLFIEGYAPNTPYRILDINGKVLQNGVLGEESMILMHELSPGVYILNVGSGMAGRSLRISIVR